MSKSGAKSARIGNLLEQLQKLCLAVSESRNELDKDNEQLRYITNKVQQMLSTQEKCRKDLMTKFPDGISTLLLILEMSNDSQLTLNVMGCLSELLTSGKRASVLAAKGTVDIVLKIIINASHESPPNEEVILLGHVLLTKVGPKDRKFCLKARLTGALQVTMNTIRNNTCNFRALQCTLVVMKLYTANAVNCNNLGKAGAVSVLFKIVTACGHKRITCLKLALDVIAALVKSKTSASKAVNYGAVPVLLQMFNDWHRTDHHNRQTGVRKAIAGVLKSITMTKSGKKAFIQSDGIKVLYTLSLENLDSRELDSVNILCSQILRRCFPKNKLPIPCASSPLSFQILDIDSASNHNTQSAVDANEDSGDDESSEVESDDEASAKEDKEETGSQATSLDGLPNENKKQKPRDDLHMYEKFFPELFEYQVESDDSLEDEPILPNTIMIPTASDDPLSPMSSFCNLYSSNVEQTDNNNGQDPYGLSGTDPPLGTSPPQTSGSPTSNDCTSRCSSTNEIRSVLPSVKQAMPEIHGHYPPAEPEPLGQKKTSLQKTMIFRDIERLIQPQKVMDKVVYDLDALLKQDTNESNATLKPACVTKSRIGSGGSNSSTSDSEKMSNDGGGRTLKFESRFECGNLRKAIQIRENEYDLILNPDINCRHHHQWFYFEVSNMEADVPYKFNIVNCEKINSQFNFGMQPVLYSSEEALNGRPGWIRAGSNVCYYRNYFSRQQNGCQRSKTYFTSTFTITFPYTDDTCYLAYHYPYSFTMLQDHLSRLEASVSNDIFYRRLTLCHTLSGNPCDVITITAAPRRKDSFSLESFKNRPYVFLTARVHPGESNSSWVMKGVLDFLLSALYTAKNLRERFIFKIIPMLNVDGVINGCHRCSLSGDDLNRRWINPSMILHPTIYHTKGLLQYLQSTNRTPLVYCDFHGHSRKKNVFIYGCSKAASISSGSSPEVDDASVSNDRATDAMSESDSTSSMDASEIVEDLGYRTLPSVLHNIAPAFFLGSCSFLVEPSKESTARVVVWREIGVLRSYTMESTYSGCDQGPYKGCHLGTRELEEMGRFFCAGLLRIARPFARRDRSQASNHSIDTNENSDNWIRSSELFVPVPSIPHDDEDSSGEN
ncbi:cytosolic carboxypeptidase 1 [Exaiptasia diaphana]|uniref:tubulin-glutamate carboxypeptidase n=1 Tax=Exaiptasia diaphana TaxID=2652724 RepID=A0A913X1K6_EXADI|nr:cytosolic carboxypeptidase 1 [Exaiptasia diaphana]KXJ16139.1 Cytosolic carboxypeptidase 1 [Exaiptasia diaphana]